MKIFQKLQVPSRRQHRVVVTLTLMVVLGIWIGQSRADVIVCRASWNWHMISLAHAVSSLRPSSSAFPGIIGMHLNESSHDLRIQDLHLPFPEKRGACLSHNYYTFRHAQVLWLNGKAPAAVEAFQQIVSHDDFSIIELGAALYQAGRIAEAEEAWRQASPLVRERLSSIFAMYGDMSLKKERFHTGESYFRTSLAVSPNNPAAWQGLGDVLAHQKRWTEARRAYERAAGLQIGPKASVVANLWRYGDLLVRGGEPREGEQALRITLALAPDNAAAWVSLGDALWRLGRTQEAGEAYKRGLALNPQSPDANVSPAHWMLVVAHDRPYAELLFERAVKLDAKGFEPDHIESGVWIYQQIIVAYWQIGDFQSAEHWSLRAMRGFPDHFLPYYYLGLTKLRAGHPEQAIPWLEEALRRNQSEPGIEKALDEALAAVER